MLEVITGCMYSGKSEELIRRLRRWKLAGQRVVAFKSSLDNRYSATSITTHPVEGLGDFFDAKPVRHAADLRLHVGSVPYLKAGDVLGVDEIQFLEEEVTDLFERLSRKGVRVIVAGLDLDSEGKPFGSMPKLLALADSVVKLTAVCTSPKGDRLCGNPATRTFRHPESSSGEQIQVGSAGIYEARCKACWSEGR